MGIGASGTVFDLSPIPDNFRWSSGTGVKKVQRAVTEQTVELFQSLVAGIILTAPVCKKTARILSHISFLFP
jgi:hypothetical protein